MGDGDLTNLSWLHNVSIFPPQSPPPPPTTERLNPPPSQDKANHGSQQQQQPPKKLLVSPRTNVSQLSAHHAEMREHYRLCGVTEKPPFSYAALICLAMRERARGRGAKMTLRQIYRWIKENFAYYRTVQDKSWQVGEILKVDGCKLAWTGNQ